jgi:hypothetical protein
MVGMARRKQQFNRYEPAPTLMRQRNLRHHLLDVMALLGSDLLATMLLAEPLDNALTALTGVVFQAIPLCRLVVTHHKRARGAGLRAISAE